MNELKRKEEERREGGEQEGRKEGRKKRGKEGERKTPWKKARAQGEVLRLGQQVASLLSIAQRPSGVSD